MKNKSLNSGTTMVELLIVVAIVGTVFMIAPSLIKNVTRFSLLNTARLETQRNVRESLSQINEGLRQASAQSVVISQESGQPPYSRISFTTEDGRSLGYYQSGKSLNFVNNGSTKTMSGDLRYLAFSLPRSDNEQIISVSVTYERATYDRKVKALQMAIEKVRIMND